MTVWQVERGLFFHGLLDLLLFKEQGASWRLQPGQLSNTQGRRLQKKYQTTRALPAPLKVGKTLEPLIHSLSGNLPVDQLPKS